MKIHTERSIAMYICEPSFPTPYIIATVTIDCDCFRVLLFRQSQNVTKQVSCLLHATIRRIGLKRSDQGYENVKK
jgi:hypothetical protein